VTTKVQKSPNRMIEAHFYLYTFVLIHPPNPLPRGNQLLQPFSYLLRAESRKVKLVFFLIAIKVISQLAWITRSHKPGHSLLVRFYLHCTQAKRSLLPSAFQQNHNQVPSTAQSILPECQVPGTLFPAPCPASGLICTFV